MLEVVMYNIRTRRVAQEMSQGKLAEACGWYSSAGRIANYENLKREPTLADLDKMATAVGATLEEVLFGDQKNQREAATVHSSVTPPLLDLDEIDAFISGSLSENKRSVKMNLEEIKDKGVITSIIKGDAMQSPYNIKRSLCDGDKIDIDVTRQPKPYEIIVARVGNQTEVREYVTNGKKYFLKAFNPIYPDIELDNDVKILGVVVNKHVDLI